MHMLQTRDANLPGRHRQLAQRGSQLLMLFLMKFDEAFALRGALARDVAALEQELAAFQQRVQGQANWLVPVMAQLECRIAAIEAAFESPAVSDIIPPPAFLGHYAAFQEVPSVAAAAFRRERTALRERMGIPPRTCTTGSQCSISPDGSNSAFLSSMTRYRHHHHCILKSYEACSQADISACPCVDCNLECVTSLTDGEAVCAAQLVSLLLMSKVVIDVL